MFVHVPSSAAALPYVVCLRALATLCACPCRELSDIDKDEHLDRDEFALMYYLVNLAQSGHPLPHVLPSNFVPPLKR